MEDLISLLLCVATIFWCVLSYVKAFKKSTTTVERYSKEWHSLRVWRWGVLGIIPSIFTAWFIIFYAPFNNLKAVEDRMLLAMLIFVAFFYLTLFFEGIRAIKEIRKEKK